MKSREDRTPALPLRRKGAPRISRKALFALHGWLGMFSGLLLFIICFSGAAAVLSHEIDWLTNPAIRVDAHRGEPAWGRLEAGVKAAFPEASLGGLHAPCGPRFAAEAIITAADGQTRRVYLDPRSGEVRGSTSYFNVQRFLRSFHMQLFIGGWLPGIFIVGSFGFPLLLSVVSGMLFYKGWHKHLFRLRLGKGSRVFLSDLHRLTGVWSLAFALVIAVTGIWYFVEMGIFRSPAKEALFTPAPKLAAERMAEIGSGAAVIGAGEAAAAAAAALPGLEVRTLRPPSEADDVYYVDGQNGALLVRDRASVVLLDPYDGEVVSARPAQDLTALRRWADTADELHFGTLGTWGGLWTKLLWAGFGMLLPLLVLAGGLISVRRGAGIRAARIGGLLGAGLMAAAAWEGAAEIRGYGDLFPGLPAGAVVFLVILVAVMMAVTVAWLWLAFARNRQKTPADHLRRKILPSLTETKQYQNIL